MADKYTIKDKFVVTGGLGFIGSHLVQRLLALGARVVVVDNKFTGFESNLESDIDHPNLTILDVDISDWNELSKNFSYLQDATGVFHLAACARIQPSIHAPLLTHNTNVTGTLHILEMMRMCRIKSIVYSASSSYYGKDARIPSFESDPNDCQTPYSISKYLGELYCKTWGKLHGTRNACLRYFNVYGRRSPLIGPYAPVIGLFFRQAMTGKAMTVVGDGEQRRDFTHVGDVVNANILSMNKLNSPDWNDVSGLTMNVGTGKNYTISEVAACIRTALLGSGYTDIKIVNVPERIGEAKASLADATLARQVIGWEATVDLVDGVEDLKNYYLNNRERFNKGDFEL